MDLLQDLKLPTCTWETIESMLSNPPEERSENVISTLLPWFRERSSLFQTLPQGVYSLLLLTFLTFLYSVGLYMLFITLGCWRVVEKAALSVLCN